MFWVVFLIGLLIGILEKNNLSNGNLKWFNYRFCGGFTTFSTFGYRKLFAISKQ
jgi:CrcB protein